MKRTLALSFVALMASSLLAGEETPLKLIRSASAPNPREMSNHDLSVFINAAKHGIKNDNFLLQSECIQFLIDAGDIETIQSLLKTATNYNIYPRSRRAWNYFERSENPDLLVLFHDAMRDDLPARINLYANEFLDVPSSTRAAMATLSIIANSKVFSPEVTEWAVQKRALEKQNNQFEALRESARAFSSHNLKALQEGRYSDAVVPPNRAESALPQGAPSSPEVVEEQPAANVPAVDANAHSGSHADSSPSQGSPALSPWQWAGLIAVAVFALALGINRAIRARKGKAEINDSNHRDR
jgi:hypothetical protein